MKIDKTWTLPASADRVYAMLTDPAFSEHVAIATGALEQSASVTAAGEGARVVVKRSMPTDEVPDALKRFVGPTLAIVETQTWGGSDAAGNRAAELDVDIVGMPVRYTGRIDLRADTADRTTIAITGDLKASLPLFGGQIEKAAGPALASALDVEASESADWIATH